MYSSAASYRPSWSGWAVSPIPRAALFEIAGHDVPADPPLCQVVERRHAPGEQIGRLVGQGGGDAETDVLGYRRQEGHDQHRGVDRALRGIDDRRRTARPAR